MLRVQLYYSEVPIAVMLVDGVFSPLVSSTDFHLRLPPAVLRQGSRIDTRVALLREDVSLLGRCRPVFRYQKLTIPVPQIALYPQLIDLFLEGASTTTIRDLTSQIGKICHANANHLDCRAENLREVV